MRTPIAGVVYLGLTVLALMFAAHLYALKAGHVHPSIISHCIDVPPHEKWCRDYFEASKTLVVRK
jgi:hypothetical protein